MRQVCARTTVIRTEMMRQDAKNGLAGQCIGAEWVWPLLVSGEALTAP
jgi:hypothetical protein